MELAVYESKGSYSPCYLSHKPLPIVVGDVTYEIRGGSCTAAPPSDMDVLIAFDRGYVLVPHAMPWLPGEFVFFPITDMSVPKSVTQFTKLIEWTAEQLVSGKKIHAGCIGGHGRTGTFLSALVKHMTGEEDAITYVRENYCKKVVESSEQVKWLHEHFGIKKVAGSKSGHSKKSNWGSYGGESYQGAWTNNSSSYGKVGDSTIRPVKSRASIHGYGEDSSIVRI